MLSFEIDAEARLEIQQTADYYDRQNPGLGTQFEADLLRTRDRILSNPLAYAEEEDGFRYAVLEIFPYSLIYKVQPHRILAIALAHHKRRPGYWYHRIRQ